MSTESCYVRLDGPVLIAGNDFIERRWEIIQGQLFAIKITDKISGQQWLSGKAAVASLLPPADCSMKDPQISLTQQRGVWRAGEAESLVAEIICKDERSTLTYRLQIFTDVAAINMQLIMPAHLGETVAAADGRGEAAATGIETDPPKSNDKQAADVIDAIIMANSGITLTQIELHDQTDQYNTLVHERSWILHPSDRVLNLAGNLFAIEDDFTGCGLIWLKQAPLPHARPVKTSADCMAQNGSVRLCGHGAMNGEGYMTSLIAYQGGKVGRTRALHQLQRAHRQLNPDRDVRIISNTWGDRNRDSRICESFLYKEIEAGAKIGIDVAQIDDGWQKGRTANSTTAGGVWNGFWAADPEFWATHVERFPNGLRPVVQAAKARGVQIGLWFAPDSSKDFQNWERDAQQLLALHREHGVNYFKIDGVKATTKLSERRLHQMFDTVIRESAGQVSFDLDVTAEIRPGYFGAIGAGPLFVENRYTDWRNYYPHATLRNLWMLSSVVDPFRLRMEFLNPHRNAQNYSGEPLAPANYDITCLFATVMMSNPLAWMEVSSLPESDIEKLAPLVRTWKAHRAAMMQNITLPIGEMPNGVAWTGFFNYGSDTGYVLAFRECNAKQQWRLQLPVGKADDAIILGGDGSIEIVQDQYVLVTVPSERQFVWAQLNGYTK